MAEYQLTIFLWLNRKKSESPRYEDKGKRRYDNSKSEIKIYVVLLRGQSRNKHGYFKIL